VFAENQYSGYWTLIHGVGKGSIGLRDDILKSGPRTGGGIPLSWPAGERFREHDGRNLRLDMYYEFI
jgi:hypothetical protein